VSLGVRRPWQAVDYEEIVSAYPPAPEYYETTFFDGPEAIARLQLQRLKERAWHAYRVPFFHRRWDAAGFHPSALHSLEDLHKVPPYTVDDIRASIEDHPPWGDYQGVTPDQAPREPVRVFMSGGTTGSVRPTFYTQWDREVGALLLARQLYRQGVRVGDTVLNSWAYGTHNGAFIFDEALHHWLNCVVLTTSTGNVTSSERQVELAIAYGAAAILTTGDYLLRLADVARELGYDPRADLALKAIPNIGDRALLEETFGAEYFDTYGFHEVQTVAVECEAHEGLHIFEDAFVVQVLDPETSLPAPDGQLGSLCITELYKTGSPQFRYNIMDLAALHPPGRCACGSWLRRMTSFAGRGDNMVKLRGVNVWPEAVGSIAAATPGVSTDYFVRAVRRHNRDELLLSAVSEAAPSEFGVIARALEQRLRDHLGVRIEVEVVAPGSLDSWTGTGTAAKLRRFRDERDGPRS
jgi:phenylacetate-CoA ligase